MSIAVLVALANSSCLNLEQAMLPDKVLTFAGKSHVYWRFGSLTLRTCYEVCYSTTCRKQRDIYTWSRR